MAQQETVLDDESLQSLFSWIDSIPLSRRKKNITRDFSDGLLVAEIMHHYFPRVVEIHNYVSANSVNQKLNNWGTLNRQFQELLSCLTSCRSQSNLTDESMNEALVILELCVWLTSLKEDVRVVRQKVLILDSNEETTTYSTMKIPRNCLYCLGAFNSSVMQSIFGKVLVSVTALSKTKAVLRKVLSKIGYTVPADVMRKISECSPGVVEVFLFGLLQKIEAHLVKSRKSTKGSTIESRPYYNARSLESGPQSGEIGSSTNSQQTEYAVKNPIPLAQLNLSPLDNQTRLILEEKEQALLASQETVQILQVKIRRLEHLLHLKDLRLQDMQQRMARADSASTVQSSQRH